MCLVKEYLTVFSLQKRKTEYEYEQIPRVSSSTRFTTSTEPSRLSVTFFESSTKLRMIELFSMKNYTGKRQENIDEQLMDRRRLSRSENVSMMIF